MSIDGIKSRKKPTRSSYRAQTSSKNVVKITTSSTRQRVSPPTVSQRQPVKKRTAVVQKSPVDKKIKKYWIKETSFLDPIESFDFDISSDELIETKSVKNLHKKKKKHVVRKILLGFFILCVLLIIAVLVWGNDIISKITGGQSGIFDLPSFFQESYVDLKTDRRGRTNILVFGTSGYDMEGTNGDYEHDGAQLTDTIMVISLDQKTGDVAMVNLPRDLKVKKYCTGTGKVNEIYWCNNMDGSDESGGANALVQDIESIFDIEIQYYAHVNWETLVSIVDTLDSIEVTLDEDIFAACDTGVYMNLYAGVPQKLNGKEALCVARTRYNTQNGDFSRNASQQKILIALKNRVLEKKISIIDALNIVNSLGDNVRTNVSLDEMKAGMHILESFGIESMRQIPLVDSENGVYYVSTAMIDGISYVIPSAGEGIYSDIQKYVNKMLSSDPIAREGSTIEVLNGSGESGVASAEKVKLEKEGFEITEIGDAPEGEYKDVSIYILNEEQVGTKAKLEEFYGAKIKPAEELPEDITSECDFVIIIGGAKDEE